MSKFEKIMVSTLGSILVILTTVMVLIVSGIIGGQRPLTKTETTEIESSMDSTTPEEKANAQNYTFDGGYGIGIQND